METKEETISQETQPIETQKVKNPKKVEAGKKGALVKKLKKEHREKEVERVTYSEKSEEPKKEKPVRVAKVVKHGNLIDYGLIGLSIIGVVYIGYRKLYKESKKTESVQVNKKLDMK